MEQLAMDVAGPYPITTLRAPAWMIAEQRGCVAVEEIRVRRFSEHFREREGPSLVENLGGRSLAKRAKRAPHK